MVRIISQNIGMDKMISKQLKKNIELFDTTFKTDQSFDMLRKNIVVGNRDAAIYFVDGFVKDDVMERIMSFLMSLNPREVDCIKTAAAFDRYFIPYVETSFESDVDTIVTQVLSGTVALFVDGITNALMIDTRTYPARGPEEPGDSKVLRGSRDGFVETIVFNTALIRRRIRDPHLTMEMMQVGKESKTDVVLCYMDNRVDKTFLKTLRDKIGQIKVNALSLAQESLAECLIKKQWFNPFPKVRYSERPDVAAASVLEGKIIVIVDNSPAVMMLPTSIFDFVQDSNDFYFPPFVGTYLRIVRIFVFVATLLVTPVWLLLIQNPSYIPPWLSFIQVAEPNGVPIVLQLIILEIVIDGLKLASLNTPSSLSNSFSVIGALILGDFAIQARWLVSEVVFYMAFVAIANFAQPSYELGYAFKLSRIMLLILTALFNLWGFIAGVLVIILVVATTKTITGASYLYPLIPFNGKDFGRIFLRRPIEKSNT